MTEEEARSLLAGEDAEAASAAFALLEPPAREFLRCYLRSRLAEADAQDVAQETLIRVWSTRERFCDRGRASWLAFLKLIADRCLVDLLRARGTVVELPEEVPHRDFVALDALLDATATADQARACLEAADVLWLELNAALPADEHRRRLLAAQLFYVDRAPWKEVLAMLNAARPEDPVAREQLDAWLTDPAVLRQLGAAELHLAGPRLAACLCEQQHWPPVEARVIGWRVGNGLTAEQVAARRDCGLTEEELRELDVRLAGAFPFRRRMQELLQAIGERGRVNDAHHLARTGLWQRLAFQYRYWDDLPLRDIRTRIAPPAEEVQFEVTAGMLNVWLSGGRLLRRLAQYLEREPDV